MPSVLTAAAFQHVEEAHYVGVHVGVRIDKRVAHARLRGEVHHVGEAPRCEQRGHRRAIDDIERLEGKSGRRGEFAQARPLEPHVVIGIEVVEPGDVAPLCEQPARHVEADEPGRPRHQDGFALAHSAGSRRYTSSSRRMSSSPK